MKKYRLAIKSSNVTTSMPIELTEKEVELFKDIEAYCEKHKTSNYIVLEEEI